MRIHPGPDAMCPKQTFRPIQFLAVRVVGWFAQIVQQPDKQFGTSLVICGRHRFQQFVPEGIESHSRTLVPQRFGDLRYPTLV